MNGVRQTIMASKPPFSETNRPGNCTQAAVATMFNLPLEAVPHFVELTLADPRGDAWFYVLTSWTLGKYEVTWVTLDPTGARDLVWNDDPTDQLLLAGGKTERGTSHHVVVDGNLNLAWDPHPSDAGLVEIETVDAVANPIPFHVGGDERWSILNPKWFW